MNQFKYFVHDACDNRVRACVLILQDKGDNTGVGKTSKSQYHRIIALAHPNMKLKVGVSIKKVLSDFAKKTANEWISNNYKHPTLPENFKENIWEDFFNTWIFRYGTINIPSGVRCEKNVKLCNHEYRMIISPDGRI